MKSLSVRPCLGGIRQQLWRSERAEDMWQGHLGLCSEESTGLWSLLRHNTSSDSLLDGKRVRVLSLASDSWAWQDLLNILNVPLFRDTGHTAG